MNGTSTVTCSEPGQRQPSAAPRPPAPAVTSISKLLAERLRGLEAERITETGDDFV